MSTRSVITRSVQRLLRTGKVRNLRELAYEIDVSVEYLPRKIREDRWSVDDIDMLAEVFDVSCCELITGEPAPEPETLLSTWESTHEGPTTVFEIAFELEDGSDVKCLAIGADNANAAINTVLSRWTPEHPIVNMGVTSKEYHSVQLAPLRTP